MKIAGENKTKVEAAKSEIMEIVNKPSFGGRGGGRDSRGGGRPSRDDKPIPKFAEGEIVDGTVVRIVDFGAFVQLPGDIDGLLHISKIADHRVEKVSDYLAIDQKVKVKILEQNGRKIGLGLEK